MNMLAILDPTFSGLEQLRALIAAGSQPTIHDTLDIALISVDEGVAVVEARPGPAHLNPAGIVQGGYAAVVMDTACGCAVHSALPAQTGFSTIELKVSYVRPITPDMGVIRAEGRLISLGRRVAFSEAKLLDARGRVLASATSSLIVLSAAPGTGAG